MTSDSPPRVVIIGGGITGLSAAWRIQQSAIPSIEIIVLEASDRWGGKVVTDQLNVNGEIIQADAGAESFVTRKPEVWQLAHELGLDDDILPVENEARGTYLLHEGHLRSVPLSPLAFIRSPLMSLSGKFRLLAEPFIPARRDELDESLAEFARRRLGHQAADNLITPILAGIYNADPERQSILTTSPIMRHMEREYGSLFVASIARARKSRRDDHKRPSFITFRTGSDQIIQSLVRSISGNLHLRCPVLEVTQGQDQFVVECNSGQTFHADAILLATPSNVSASILANITPEAATSMQAIRHASIGTILLAFPPGSARHRTGMTGLMVPRREGRLIDAVTWLSQKIPEEKGQAAEVLKIYFGGSSPHLMDLQTAKVVELLLAELADILSIKVKPLAFRVHRWPNSYPQADVGHLNLVNQIEQGLPPGLYTAGSSYRGLAVPDCIRQADRAADQITNFLKTKQISKEST